jgi:hypothetical protein
MVAEKRSRAKRSLQIEMAIGSISLNGQRKRQELQLKLEAIAAGYMTYSPISASMSMS